EGENPTQGTAFQNLLGFHVRRHQPLVMGNHQHHAPLLGGPDHLLRFFPGGSHRLFAQDMLPGLGGGYRDGTVIHVGSANADGVDVRPLKQVPVIRVNVTPVPAGKVRRPFFHHVAEGHQLRLRMGRKLGNVPVPSDAPATDHRHLHFCHAFSPPPFPSPLKGVDRQASTGCGAPPRRFGFSTSSGASDHTHHISPRDSLGNTCFKFSTALRNPSSMDKRASSCSMLTTLT